MPMLGLVVTSAQVETVSTRVALQGDVEEGAGTASALASSHSSYTYGSHRCKFHSTGMR